VFRREANRKHRSSLGTVGGNLDINSFKNTKWKSPKFSLISKKAKGKEGGKNQYSLIRLQQWTGGKGTINNVLKGPLDVGGERCSGKSICSGSKTYIVFNY
jgi:hypothetical protein